MEIKVTFIGAGSGWIGGVGGGGGEGGGDMGGGGMGGSGKTKYSKRG